MPKITMQGAFFNAATLKDSGEQVLTVKECRFENVAPDDKPEDMKWVLHFEETTSGVVLSSTRLDQMVSLFGTNESEAWHGKQVTVYCDPDVRFAGKKVGGVAIKAAPTAKAAAPSSPVMTWPMNDEFEGLLMSQVPKEHLQQFLQDYPQADLQFRKAVRMELADREE